MQWGVKFNVPKILCNERDFMTPNCQVDIYSSSWGPDDDGTTVEGPGTTISISWETK